MSDLVPYASSPIRSRLREARGPGLRHGAVVGAISAYAGAASVAFGLSLHPWLLGATVAGAVVGGLLGYVGPFGLDRLRGRVPLPMLMALVPLMAGAVATSVAIAAAWVVGSPLALAALYGGVAAMLVTGVAWLPYTVATVMQLRRWPVLAAAVLVSPLSGPITQWLWLALH